MRSESVFTTRADFPTICGHIDTTAGIDDVVSMVAL
jgi:hypothetical protein